MFRIAVTFLNSRRLTKRAVMSGQVFNQGYGRGTASAGQDGSSGSMPDTNTQTAGSRNWAAEGRGRGRSRGGRGGFRSPPKPGEPTAEQGHDESMSENSCSDGISQNNMNDPKLGEQPGSYRYKDNNHPNQQMHSNRNNSDQGFQDQSSGNWGQGGHGQQYYDQRGHSHQGQQYYNWGAQRGHSYQGQQCYELGAQRGHRHQGQQNYSQRGYSYQGQQGERYNRQGSSGGRWRDSNDQYDDQQGQQQYRTRRKDDPDDSVFLSKTLSFLLRHGAEKQGFKLMKGGFLYVDEILKRTQKLHGFTIDDVSRIVAQNEKQRFAMQKEEGTNRWMIRANQGHTIEVDDLELTPITSADQVPIVLHGTYHQAWNSIKTQGLCRFKRNHIHFAAGEPGENGVISGMRSSCEVLIFLDLEKALKDGLKFFLSANNVILSPGDARGFIYPCYFSAAVTRNPRQMLQFDNKISGKDVSAEDVADELDKAGGKKKKKKKKKGKGKQDMENTENGSPREELDIIEVSVIFTETADKKEEKDGEMKEKDEKEEKKGKKDEANDKEKQEDKEEEQFEDALETQEVQQKNVLQKVVPDRWDAAVDNEKVQSASEMPQSTKQSEPNKGVTESGASEGALEPKTPEMVPKTEIPKETAESKIVTEVTEKKVTQSEDLNGATGGVLCEPTGDPDFTVEEEWEVVNITSAEESQSAVDYLLDQKDPVSVICRGESNGEGDGKIAVIVIHSKSKSYIYQLFDTEEDFIEAGKLRHFFFDTNLMKVFHDAAWQSAVLFKQYEIVLDGTPVFDTSVVQQKEILNENDMENLRLDGFMPARWCQTDNQIDARKWTQSPLDKEIINELIERCKVMLKFYQVFKENPKRLTLPKKEIFEEVNRYVDKNTAKKLRASFKSQTSNKQTPDQSASSSSKGPQKKTAQGTPKKKGKKK